MSERVSEAGDQPECTDPSLTDPVCAYQLALAAMRMGTFRRFDPNLLHTAMRDILASNDPAAPDAFDYLCSAGVPSLLSRTGEEPYAVLAARRSDHPKYRSLLVTLGITLGRYCPRITDTYRRYLGIATFSSPSRATGTTLMRPASATSMRRPGASSKREHQARLRASSRTRRTCARRLCPFPSSCLCDSWRRNSALWKKRLNILALAMPCG